MINVSLVIIIFLILTNIATIYFLYKFAIVILNIESEIEKSLDQLEESYKSVSEILEIEVFFDSIEVRKVINEIKNSRTAIHRVAQNISKNFRTTSESKEKIKDS